MSTYDQVISSSIKKKYLLVQFFGQKSIVCSIILRNNVVQKWVHTSNEHVSIFRSGKTAIADEDEVETEPAPSLDDIKGREISKGNLVF